MLAPFADAVQGDSEARSKPYYKVRCASTGDGDAVMRRIRGLPLLDVVVELLSVLVLAKLGESLGFNLTNTFTSDGEFLADFL